VGLENRCHTCIDMNRGNIIIIIDGDEMMDDVMSYER